MLAIFELQSNDLENNPPLFVKSMMEITLLLNEPECWTNEFPIMSPPPSPLLQRLPSDSHDGTQESAKETFVLASSSGRVRTRTRRTYSSGRKEPMVHAIFSTPTFNILPFLHSVDFALSDSVSNSTRAG